MTIKDKNMRLVSSRFIKAMLVALTASLWSMSISLSAAEFSPQFKGTDIEEVINIVAKNLRRNIIVDPNVRGKVNFRSYDLLNEEQYYQVFLNILQVYGFAVVEMPNNVLKVVRDKDAKNSNIPVVDGALFNGDEMITRVVPVFNVSVRELAPILRQLNDVAGGGNVVANDPSNTLLITGRAAVVNRLVEIIDRIDQAGDQEVEIIKLQFAAASEMVRIIDSINKSQKGNQGPANLEPRVVADDRTNSVIISGDVKARERIANLIKRLDLELKSSGNTRVHYIKYAKAEDIVGVLQGVSDSIQAEEAAPAAGGAARRSSRGASDVSINSHEETNALVITAPPDMMRSLEEVIRKLDIPRAQVQVEAMIVEIFEGDGTTLGVQVASLAGGTQFTNSGIPIGALGVAIDQARDDVITDNIIGEETGNVTPISRTEEGDPTLLGQVLGGANGFISGIVNEDWGVIVQAVSNDTNANVLSTPFITTMDNTEAFFIVGQEVPIITGSSTGNNNTNPFQTVERQEVGIRLLVTPQINEGTGVLLNIEQEVSSVSGATAVDISINTREIRTSVFVEDGGTVVLGGLIDEDVQESVSKVPILGDIPFLGKLFRSTSSTKNKRNLMVFLRPTIIRDGATLNRISHSKYNFIRAQQLEKEAKGVPLMPGLTTPTLPDWEDAQTVPPAVEEYLQNKKENEKKGKRKKDKSN
jgi:general secretion pathway protein D